MSTTGGAASAAVPAGVSLRSTAFGITLTRSGANPTSRIARSPSEFEAASSTPVSGTAQRSSWRKNHRAPPRWLK